MLRQTLLFGAVWLLLWPLVLGYYAGSDLRHGRFRYPTCGLKTGLVRRAVYAKLVLH